jgi:rod shape-determining protein MreD
VLQTAFVSYIWPPEHFITLDLFLTLALLCALVAPVHDARLAAWIVGFAEDLSPRGGALGVYALALGLLALIVTALRRSVNQGRWWTRLTVAFLAAFPAQALVWLHYALQDRLTRGLAMDLAWAGGWGTALLRAALTAFVAALLAAIITQLPWLLDRTRRHRRGHAAGR